MCPLILGGLFNIIINKITIIRRCNDGREHIYYYIKYRYGETPPGPPVDRSMIIWEKGSGNIFLYPSVYFPTYSHYFIPYQMGVTAL